MQTPARTSLAVHREELIEDDVALRGKVLVQAVFERNEEEPQGLTRAVLDLGQGFEPLPDLAHAVDVVAQVHSGG